MKTALLLPGHMRAYRETFNNQLKTILEPNNCDIYISTSTTKTVVNGNDISSVEYNKKKLEEELNLFYGELLKGLIIEEEPEEDVAASTRNRYPDRSKQWLRLKQCNQMSKDSAVEYDFIIRSRTDLLFNAELILESGMGQAIHLMRHFDSKIPIHDQFAFGTPEMMDTYCELYDVFVPRQEGGRSEEQLYRWLTKQQVPLTYYEDKLGFVMMRGN